MRLELRRVKAVSFAKFGASPAS